MNKKKKKLLGRIHGLGLVLGLVGVWGFVFFRPEAPVAPVSWRPTAGPEWVVVFLGSSTCGASNMDGLPEAVRRMNSTLKERALMRGFQFAAVGVAVDLQPDRGLEFLSGFGPFDEVIAGHDWLNTGSVRYLLRDLAAPPNLPQVVVVRREIALGPGGESISVSEEELMIRKIGGAQIIQWAKLNFPL